MKNDYSVHDVAYCYPGTSVLINKLNITEKVLLEKKEHDLVSIRNSQLKINPLYENYYFSTKYIQKIHNFLFQDIYKWAGKFRTVRMSKNNFSFAYPEYIKQELEKIFEYLSDHCFFKNLTKELISEELAYFKAEVNTIHPFREGNGRTIRLLIEDIAHKAGYYFRFNQKTNKTI